MRIVMYTVVAAALVCMEGVSATAKKADPMREKTMFATNRYFSKGGLGIVNTSLYIVVKSSKTERNELIVKPTEQTEERWKGKKITEGEVVFVYEGKVWESRNLPNGFDLSKAIVISFEKEKVRFFDFHATQGGYYERIIE